MTRTSLDNYVIGDWLRRNATNQIEKTGETLIISKIVETERPIQLTEIGKLNAKEIMFSRRGTMGIEVSVWGSVPLGERVEHT